MRREAVPSLFNILGACWAVPASAVEIADTALGGFAGAPRATLIGRGRKADASHAALINCLASSIYSIDDIHEQAVIHPDGRSPPPRSHWLNCIRWQDKRSWRPSPWAWSWNAASARR